MLATSRRNLALSPEGIKEVTVPPLTLPASIELLTRCIDRGSLPDEAWRQIAEKWVGRFPLALELLNTTLQAGAMTPQALLRKADDSRPAAELDAQMGVLQEAVPQGMLRGVTEALQISYEQLSPEAQKAARLLAQLAPEPIPESLIAVLPSDRLSPAIRTTLRTRSMVMSVSGGTVPMFGTIHRVLADFLRSVSGSKEEDIQLLSDNLLNIMTFEACRDPKQWALMIACEPHAEELLTVPRDLAPEERGPTVVQLMLLLGTLHSAQGLYERAREMEEKAVSYSITNLGEDHPDTLAALSNLALTLSDQGEYGEAAALQRTVLERRQRILGEDHPDTLTAMNNLAATLSDQGEYGEAVALQRTDLERTQRILGQDHPDTLTALSNLALTLSRQGEYGEAVALQRTVLERRQRILGKEHPSTSISAWNYLNGLIQTGETETALEVLRGFLLWLLEEDPSTLGGDQQQIRAGVATLLEAGGRTQEE